MWLIGHQSASLMSRGGAISSGAVTWGRCIPEVQQGPEVDAMLHRGCSYRAVSRSLRAILAALFKEMRSMNRRWLSGGSRRNWECNLKRDQYLYNLLKLDRWLRHESAKSTSSEWAPVMKYLRFRLYLLPPYGQFYPIPPPRVIQSCWWMVHLKKKLHKYRFSEQNCNITNSSLI